MGKSPLLAAVLSLLLPGLGQIYNGQFFKGILLIIGYAIVWSAITGVYFSGAAATSGFGLICCLPLFVVPLAILLYSIFDAYHTAKRITIVYR